MYSICIKNVCMCLGLCTYVHTSTYTYVYVFMYKHTDVTEPLYAINVERFAGINFHGFSPTKFLWENFHGTLRL